MDLCRGGASSISCTNAPTAASGSLPPAPPLTNDCQLVAMIQSKTRSTVISDLLNGIDAQAEGYHFVDRPQLFWNDTEIIVSEGDSDNKHTAHFVEEMRGRRGT